MDERQVTELERALSRELHATLGTLRVRPLRHYAAAAEARARTRGARRLAPLGAVLLIAVALFTGLQLRALRMPLEPGPAATPTASVSAAVASVAVERLELPAEFEPRISLVSPDGRFLAALARDRSRVVLFRIDRGGAFPALPGLTAIAEVREVVQQLSWLEDSSAVLAQVDRAPGAAAQSGRQGPAARFRILLLETDGRVVEAPEEASSFTPRRALLSPDGGWIPVHGDCCGSHVRLLSRDGSDVRTVIEAPAGTDSVGFVGWDRDGPLLYQRFAAEGSVLRAIEVGGAVRYTVTTPRELSPSYAGLFLSSADRSWHVVEFRGGIGSDVRAYRLLVDGTLRALPSEVEQSRQYGLFARGNELVFRGSDGSLRAHDIRTGTTRTLPLTVAAAGAQNLSTIGVVGRTYVWMELIRGYVGDLESGVSRELPLESPPNVLDRLDGSRLAEGRADSIAIIDLEAWLRRP